MIWYLPSFYGDVTLTAIRDGKETQIRWDHLTPTEREAMRKLSEYAQKKWKVTFPTVEKPEPKGAYRTMLDEGEIIIPAPIDKVSKRLSTDLRPGRKLVSVVKFVSGKMEEVVNSIPEKKDDPPKAVATVTKPVLSCPEPRLGRAEIKARGVLTEFLDEEQLADFLKHNRFVSVGAATGHRYMITSRHSREGLAMYGGRQLYDLDTKWPFCVHHDKMVPAAEEMLSLHLLLQLPEHELYLRGLN
jgi:hypothetical protein